MQNVILNGLFIASIAQTDFFKVQDLHNLEVIEVIAATGEPFEFWGAT